MRKHELDSRTEIENAIREITGVSVGPHRAFPKPKIGEIHYDSVEELICEWLRRCNMPERKINSMSMNGRCNCYGAGFDWTVSTIVNGDDRPKARTPRFGQPDTSGFSFEDAGKKKELGDLLGLPDSTPTPSNSSEMGDEQKLVVTQTMLKNAADAILGPQVNEMRAEVVAGATNAINAKLAELDQEIREKVKVEISLERTEATKRAIADATDLATMAALKAAEDYIEKRVPRRIEIVTPKETKLLTDEPRHKAFDEILQVISCGLHVYMWGPRGTGKTHLFPQIAEAISAKYFPIGQSLSKYDVTGYMSATGDYIKTHARDAMENGGLLGVDEGDAWTAAALIALNQPLANRYCPFPDKVVQVHPDFICMLAGNTSGFGATPEYPGRNALDSTSTDRFYFVHVDYDPDLEIALYGNTPWVRYIHSVRHYVTTQLKVTAAIPSMRPIQQGTKLLASGMDPALVVKGVLWKSLPIDMINKIETHCGKFERKEREEAA